MKYKERFLIVGTSRHGKKSQCLSEDRENLLVQVGKSFGESYYRMGAIHLNFRSVPTWRK